MRKQAGFTLIEIAIVLVIIGLLLGGVLKGQELITSARVRNLISQQDGIKATTARPRPISPTWQRAPMATATARSARSRAAMP